MVEKRRQKGFTIIEVILFLAITGLILSGVLIAVSGTINRERYNTAVKSLVDYLKGQYSIVDNVQNGRGTPVNGCTGANRGTSDCTIIGQFIQADATGAVIRSTPIIAKNDIQQIEDLRGKTDKEVFLGLALEKLTNQENTYKLEWQTLLSEPRNKDVKQPFTMVVLRSPVSNVMRTYVLPRVVSTVKEVLEADTSQAVPICVEGGGLVRYRTGMMIRQDGVNSSSIEFLTADKCS